MLKKPPINRSTSVARLDDSHDELQLTASAMTLAAVTEPQNAQAHFRYFLSRGLARADALKLWEEK